MEGIDGRLAAQLGSDVSAEGTAVTHRGVRLGVSDPTVDINDQFDRKSDREQCVVLSRDTRDLDEYALSVQPHVSTPWPQG